MVVVWWWMMFIFILHKRSWWQPDDKEVFPGEVVMSDQQCRYCVSTIQSGWSEIRTCLDIWYQMSWWSWWGWWWGGVGRLVMIMTSAKKKITQQKFPQKIFPWKILINIPTKRIVSGWYAYLSFPPNKFPQNSHENIPTKSIVSGWYAYLISP